MANALTNLTNTLISDAVLEAFTAALTPLQAFSLNVSPDPSDRGDKVKVLWTPAQDAAADFAGTYSVQDADAEGLDVTLDGHKFVSWGLTDKELVSRPQLELENFGRQKGFQLAKAVLLAIWADITNANYGAAGHTGIAANFDSDDVIDLGAACDAADWPEMGRSLVLASAYHANLRKDGAIKDASAYGGSDPVRSGEIISLDTFGAIYKSTLIPANAENLVGFAAMRDAMLVAMRYLAPQDGHGYGEARPMTDPDTGITLGYREWYDNDSGQKRAVMEAVYGSRVGNPGALKRIVSA